MAKCLCQKHYDNLRRRGNVLAAPAKYKSPHGSVSYTSSGYARFTHLGERVYEHIWLAEEALGKPLPYGAVVHHVDAKPWNNRPGNLVVCPDQAYHRLLHERSKELGYL